MHLNGPALAITTQERCTGITSAWRDDTLLAVEYLLAVTQYLSALGEVAPTPLDRELQWREVPDKQDRLAVLFELTQSFSSASLRKFWFNQEVVLDEIVCSGLGPLVNTSKFLLFPFGFGVIEQNTNDGIWAVRGRTISGHRGQYNLSYAVLV